MPITKGSKRDYRPREAAWQDWWSRFNADGSHTATWQAWHGCFVAGWRLSRAYHTNLRAKTPLPGVNGNG